MGPLRFPWRPIAVLVLLLGVLSMHAVGGAGHEAEHASPQPVSVVLGAGHGMSAAVEGVAQQVRTVTADGDRLPHDTAVALCLAVLLGGAVLLGRLARDLSRLQDAPRLLPVRVSTARRGRGPPRLLLAELCVLRT